MVSKDPQAALSAARTDRPFAHAQKQANGQGIRSSSEAGYDIVSNPRLSGGNLEAAAGMNWPNQQYRRSQCHPNLFIFKTTAGADTAQKHWHTLLIITRKCRLLHETGPSFSEAVETHNITTASYHSCRNWKRKRLDYQPTYSCPGHNSLRPARAVRCPTALAYWLSRALLATARSTETSAYRSLGEWLSQRMMRSWAG